MNKWLRLVAIPAAIVVTGCTNFSTREDIISTTLQWGHLAPLPAGASEVETDTIGNMFSRTFYLKFKATAPEIEQFVANSPSLQQHKPEYFQNRQIYLTNPKPEFRTTQTVKGRYYAIPQDKNAIGGRVAIDDTNNVVYIEISRS